MKAPFCDPIASLEQPMARLEAAAWRVARQRYGPVRQRELAQQVVELSRRYNRPEGERLVLPPGLPARMARLLFFTMADLPKVLLPLAELDRAGLLPPGQAPLKVADLGAGHGALSLGLLMYRAARGDSGPVTLHALDQDADALEALGELLEELRRDMLLGGEVALQTTASSLNSPPALDEADLIMAGGLLNELRPGADEDIARGALASLRPGCVLLLMEPALRYTARRLHNLRDQLLSSGAATMLAPCTHAGPCPMLEDERGWCHERRAWLPPPLLRQLAAATGLRRRDLRFAYLALTNAGAPGPDLPGQPSRVVSARLGGKGRVEHFLCDAAGRRRVVLLKRHLGPDSRAFSRLERGDLVWVQGGAWKGREFRLDQESEIRALDPVTGEDR